MIDTLVPQYVRMLRNLSTFFEKVEAFATQKKFDADVFLQLRLAPDQYPLVKQVQIACDQAKGGAARLAGKEPPKHEDNEKTIAEVKERIAKVLSYLETFKTEDFKGYESRHVHLPWAPGKHMLGSEFLTQMAIPNFYFHIATAYAILRSNGVDLGKTDFIGADLMMRDGL